MYDQKEKLNQKLILIVTRDCNLNCAYCRGVKNNDFMNEKTASKAIEKYFDFIKKEHGRIKFFGGEPFLAKPLLKNIVRQIRIEKKPVEIEVVSNGVLLNRDDIEWIRANRISLILSIDGDLQTQLSNKISQTAEQYEKILNLVKLYPKLITINMVLAPNNISRTFYNFSYLYNQGVERFNFLPAAYCHWDASALRCLKNQFQIILIFERQHPDIYIKNKDIKNELFLFNFGFTVDSNADIYVSDLCLSKDFFSHREKIKIGSVYDKVPFKELNFSAGKEAVFKLIEKVPAKKIRNSNKRLNEHLNEFVANLKENKISSSKRLDIKINYECNNRCLFCIQGEKRKKNAFRSEDSIKEDLERARRNCDCIVFSGGEPTVHPKILALVQYAKDLDFKSIQIQSNGRMFAYKKFCSEVIAAGANEFAPAIHGHTAQIHDFLTRSNGSFKQTLTGIMNLKKLKQRVLTNTVVTSKNYKILPLIARLLITCDVDQIQFAFVHIGGSAEKNKNWIVPKKSSVIPYIQKAILTGRNFGKKVVTEAIPYCLMKGFEECVAEQMIPQSMVIENMFEIENYADYRKNHGKSKGPYCKKCNLFSICEGPWREYPQLFGWEEFKPLKIK